MNIYNIGEQLQALHAHIRMQINELWKSLVSI